MSSKMITARAESYPDNCHCTESNCAWKYCAPGCQDNGWLDGDYRWGRGRQGDGQCHEACNIAPVLSAAVWRFRLQTLPTHPGV